METKQCSRCNQVLPVEMFYWKNGKVNDAKCKSCVCAVHKEIRAMNPKRSKTHKTCTMCNQTLPKSEEFFTPIWRQGKLHGWQGRCKPCAVEYVRVWRIENPDKLKKLRKRQLEDMKRYRREQPERFRAKDRKFDLKRKYGVTVEWYEATLQAQGGVCAICKEPPGQYRLAVDHNHDTMANRGLLCATCNTLLERVESIPDWCEKALSYLTKYEIAKREKEFS